MSEGLGFGVRDSGFGKTRTTCVVVAPNWLGDAVMAIPVIHELRRNAVASRVVVAARPHIAPLFEHVDGVDEVGDVATLGVGADVALLLPNSFRSAWEVWRAGVRERWGYKRDLRGRLLTKSVAPPRGSVHQAEYYLELLRRLGLSTDEARPAIRVDASMRERARERLRSEGWDTVRPLVGMAPGAAYGSAKRWPVRHVASFLDRLHADTDATAVLFGSAEDASVVADIETELTNTRRPMNLVGKTSLTDLIAAASWCRVFVSNDSGAMHIAAAVGVPVVAVFGPTREHETRPLSPRADLPDATILTNQVWCRPCMLRECPIDHRCMTGIPPERVFESVRARLM